MSIGSKCGVADSMASTALQWQDQQAGRHSTGLAGSLAGWQGCLAWAARAACHALLYITICELKTADLGPLQSIKPLLRASCTYLLAFTRNYST